MLKYFCFNPVFLIWFSLFSYEISAQEGSSSFNVHIRESITFTSAKYSSEAVFDIRAQDEFVISEARLPENSLLFLTKLASDGEPEQLGISIDKFGNETEVESWLNYIVEALNLESSSSIKLLEKVSFLRNYDGEKYEFISFGFQPDTGTSDNVYFVGFVLSESGWKVVPYNQLNFIKQFFSDDEFRCVEFPAEKPDQFSANPCE